MNQSGPVDSKLSLDTDSSARDSAIMIAQPYYLYIERRDAGRNMARFYALSIEETLFGEPCLVRRWGRIGTSGRMVRHCFEQEDDAIDLFLELLWSKKRRGYRPRSAFRDADAVQPDRQTRSTAFTPTGRALVGASSCPVDAP